MRRRSPRRATRMCSVAAGALLLGVAGGGPSSSRGPTELTVEASLLARLQTLADGLHNEIVLCLSGHVRGDMATALDFEMPAPRESTPVRSSFDPCPPGTLASWHNHPPSPGTRVATHSDSPYAAERARRLCVLSETDISTARRLRYPFVVVSVNSDTWCWWSLAEVESFAADSVSPGPPAPGRVAGRPDLPSWAHPGEGGGRRGQ